MTRSPNNLISCAAFVIMALGGAADVCGFAPPSPCSGGSIGAFVSFRGNNMRSVGSKGALPLHMMSDGRFSMEDIPLNQIFQKAVVLQRSGDRDGSLREYEQFLKVATSHDVDPSLYVSCLLSFASMYVLAPSDSVCRTSFSSPKFSPTSSFINAGGSS